MNDFITRLVFNPIASTLLLIVLIGLTIYHWDGTANDYIFTAIAVLLTVNLLRLLGIIVENPKPEGFEYIPVPISKERWAELIEKKEVHKEFERTHRNAEWHLREIIIMDRNYALLFGLLTLAYVLEPPEADPYWSLYLVMATMGGMALWCALGYCKACWKLRLHRKRYEETTSLDSYGSI